MHVMVAAAEGRATMLQFGRLKLGRCRYGWMLHQGPYIGKCFELYGEYSESEINVMRLFLRDGVASLDIGANIGDLTLPMSHLVGPSGRVYAFESHIENFQILNANLALNGVSNVKTFNGFVADADDVEMAGPWGEYGFVSKTWRPPVMSIDSLGLDQCAFIKVDVDGKEYEVLKSGEKTIKASEPILYFENDDREKSPRLLRYVMDLGYDLHFHAAPIFSEDNFFGNPVNHWAPQSIVSFMMLAIPQQLSQSLDLQLPKVADPDQWWPFLAK